MYVLGPDQKKTGSNLREATAFSASVVSMQLLPFDQCLGNFFPSSVWRQVYKFFKDFFFLKKMLLL